MTEKKKPISLGAVRQRYEEAWRLVEDPYADREREFEAVAPVMADVPELLAELNAARVALRRIRDVGKSEEAYNWHHARDMAEIAREIVGNE